MAPTISLARHDGDGFGGSSGRDGGGCGGGGDGNSSSDGSFLVPFLGHYGTPKVAQFV